MPNIAETLSPRRGLNAGESPTAAITRLTPEDGRLHPRKAPIWFYTINWVVAANKPRRLALRQQSKLCGFVPKFTRDSNLIAPWNILPTETLDQSARRDSPSTAFPPKYRPVAGSLR